jgi:hypothetical protein
MTKLDRRYSVRKRGERNSYRFESYSHRNCKMFNLIKKFMEVLGLIFLVGLVVMVGVLYSSFAWGFVATKMYGWFVLTVFPELPDITWYQFAGFMFFIGCFVRLTGVHIKDEYQDTSKYWTTIGLGPWLMLFGGWLFKTIIL